ncbi:MAG: PEP-CTERM sorting domain-containing protein [Aquabacterium commune]|uniref:PEP-CTERM sorting domain-containing protein n=1 Tax=Aquabacterium commune TaxID=70586 RepID=UPI003BB0BBC9
MKIRLLQGLSVLALATGAAQASTNISVSYLQPSGTVSGDLPIEVWVQISVDRQIGNELGAPFGFDADDLPRTTMVKDWFSDTPREAEFAAYSGLSIFRGYSCTPSCDVAGYQFSVALSDRLDGYTSWLGDSLRTGSFLVGTYVPDGSHVIGNITFTVLPILAFRLYGVSTTGENLVSNIGPAGGFTPCSGSASSECSFSRSITAVPEASTWAMMLIGFAALVSRRLSGHRR